MRINYALWSDLFPLLEWKLVLAPRLEVVECHEQLGILLIFHVDQQVLPARPSRQVRSHLLHFWPILRPRIRRIRNYLAFWIRIRNSLITYSVPDPIRIWILITVFVIFHSMIHSLFDNIFFRWPQKYPKRVWIRADPLLIGLPDPDP
jgi:hypothetical protein